MRLNLTLLAAFVLTAAANLALRDDPTRKNFEIIPEMVRPVAYQSFSANPVFVDGETLQAPPPGTVMRGGPAAPQPSLERGAVVFQTFCQPCHGGAGKGDGPVALRGFPPPPSLLAEHARGLTDDQIFQIATGGQKNMPSYAGQIWPGDRRSVILYLRSLQGATK